MIKGLLQVLFLTISISVYGQQFSVSAQFGYAIPQGSGISESGDPGTIDLDGGLTWGLDALYYLNEDDPKLGVGIFYLSSVLASVDDGIDAFGMSAYGVKGLYRLNSEGFAPFFGLGLGLSTLSTPEVSANGTVVSESISGSGLAILPQIGISFGGGFQISLDYLFPSGKTLDETEIDPVGKMVISLGYRKRF